MPTNHSNQNVTVDITIGLQAEFLSGPLKNRARCSRGCLQGSWE